MRDLARACQQLSGFLLRHDRVFRTGRNWAKKRRVWLSGLRVQHPAHQIVLQDYIHAVGDAAARLARIADLHAQSVKDHNGILPVQRPVPPADRTGKASPPRRHRHRPRTGRLPLGHRQDRHPDRPARCGGRLLRTGGIGHHTTSPARVTGGRASTILAPVSTARSGVLLRRRARSSLRLCPSRGSRTGSGRDDAGRPASAAGAPECGRCWP